MYALINFFSLGSKQIEWFLATHTWYWLCFLNCPQTHAVPIFSETDAPADPLEDARILSTAMRLDGGEQGNENRLFPIAAAHNPKLLKLPTTYYAETPPKQLLINKVNDPPLHRASKAGALESVRYLLTHADRLGIDPNDTDDQGNHFLFLLGEHLFDPQQTPDQQEAVYLLFNDLCSRASALNVQPPKNIDGDNLLAYFLKKQAAHPSPFGFKLLRALCVHANQLNLDLNEPVNDTLNKRILEQTIWYNVKDFFVFLCEERDNLGVEIANSWALHEAAGQKDLFYLDYLCTHAHALGIHINKKKRAVKRSEKSYLKIMKYFVKSSKPPINTQSGRSALLEAAKQGQVANVIYLCTHAKRFGVDLNTTDDFGANLYHLAMGCAPRLLQYLHTNHAALGLSVGLNDNDLLDKSPLIYAVDQDNMAVFAYLCTHAKTLGVNLDKSYHGEDILRYCLTRKKKHNIHYLLKRLDQLGIDLHKKNLWGEDAFQAAVSTKNKDIIALFKVFAQKKTHPFDLGYTRSLARFIRYKLLYQKPYPFFYYILYIFILVYLNCKQLEKHSIQLQTSNLNIAAEAARIYDFSQAFHKHFWILVCFTSITLILEALFVRLLLFESFCYIRYRKAYYTSVIAKSFFERAARSFIDEIVFLAYLLLAIRKICESNYETRSQRIRLIHFAHPTS